MSSPHPVPYVRSGSLFDAATKRKGLPGPNARAFDPIAWTNATKQGVEKRDAELFLAAVYFGVEFSAVRQTLSNTFRKIDTVDAVDLVIAVLNLSANSVREEVKAKLAAVVADGSPGYLGDDGSVRLDNANGQTSDVDGVIEILVDSMPNLLFHATDAKAEQRSSDREGALASAGGLKFFGSLERALNDCWKAVLWEGATLAKGEETAFELHPVDKPSAARWLAWQQRWHMRQLREISLLAGARMVIDDRSEVSPLLGRSVVEIEQSAEAKLRYVVDAARCNGDTQFLENGAIEGSYLRPFLDERIPTQRNGQLTYRDLWQAWWILRDSVELLLERWTPHDLGRWADVLDATLRFPLDALEEAVSEALGWSSDDAEFALSVFTTDPTTGDKGDLFTKGVWGRPIVRIGDEREARVVLAAMNPNPVLMMQRWLERTGYDLEGAVEAKTKERGRIFETEVRKAFSKALHSNGLVTEYGVATLDVDGGEQIDALIRIGSTIVVGEIKCLNVPFDSIDRYNHLRKIGDAAAQALRKAHWCGECREKVLDALNIPESERERDWRFTPLVILNTPYGCGLVHDQCPVTDVDWLEAVLSANDVVLNGMFERGKGASLPSIDIYTDQQDLEVRFPEIVTSPPSLKQELDRIDWYPRRIPTSRGDEMVVLDPYSLGIPGFEASEPNKGHAA